MLNIIGKMKDNIFENNHQQKARLNMPICGKSKVEIFVCTNNVH